MMRGTRRTVPIVDLALAVDVGGTKMAAAVVDQEGRVLSQASAPTIATTDGNALFARLVEVVASARQQGPATALRVCGVGCGGPMSSGGVTVSPLNIPAWSAFPLAARLAEYTGLPTTVDNDAKALALGEGWVGAAAGRRDFLAMVVSTGVGAGIVLDGRLLDGRSGNAGHIGHVIVEPDGRECACGARGCLEAEASGTAIRAITGADPADAPDLVRERTGRLVGRAVASAANLLDLPFACVAGSVALGYGATFFAAAQHELDRSARLDFSRGARIVPGGLGADGPLVGAAAVGWRSIGVDVGVAR
jgi:glucokinase